MFNGIQELLQTNVELTETHWKTREADELQGCITTHSISFLAVREIANSACPDRYHSIII